MMPVAERYRALRRDATDAEQRLWSMLRNRQLGGFKFRRQYAFGPYVLDFFCLRERLAIEADGGSHFTLEGQAHDRVRTVNLRDHGVRVLRFTNAQILKDSQVFSLTLISPCGRGKRNVTVLPETRVVFRSGGNRRTAIRTRISRVL